MTWGMGTFWGLDIEEEFAWKELGGGNEGIGRCEDGKGKNGSNYEALGGDVRRIMTNRWKNKSK
jgi:hypothetical protein